jgi:hypothetical protein
MPKGHLRHSHGQVQGRQGRHHGAQKLDQPKYQTGQFGFPELGQHFYSQKLIRQTISNSTAAKFIRSGLSLTKLSFSTLLPDRATNAWAVGSSVDDVSTLSFLGEVIRAVGSTTDALPFGVVRAVGSTTDALPSRVCYLENPGDIADRNVW